MRLSLLNPLSGLILGVSLTLSTLGYASSCGGYAMVQDPDGFVNLRAKDSLQSEVINQLKNTTIVHAYCDGMNNGFYYINTAEGQSGYIYHDRLSFFADNKQLIEVPLMRHDNAMSTDYASQDGHVKLSMRLAPTVVYPSKFEGYRVNHPECPHYYDGVCSFGLEGFMLSKDLPEQYYQPAQITVKINNRVMSVPKPALAGIYISAHDVAYNHVFARTKVYFDPSSRQLYLLSMQSDGAGTFSLVYQIDDKRQVTRHIWLEVI